MKNTLSVFLFFAFCQNSALAQNALSLTRADAKTLAAIEYKPAQTSCSGIAVISHGAGGSEKGYEYLGKIMAELGFYTLVVGHQESGLTALRKHMRGNGLQEGLAGLLTDVKAYEGRFMDITAAQQYASKQCAADYSVLLGHSMGAATVMMTAGAENKLGVKANDTFNAYVALSPQGSGIIFPSNAWRNIQKPILLLTGTRDEELGKASWETRLEPFENLRGPCHWLGVIDGATHMNFAGNGAARRTENLSEQTIKAFLSGAMKGKCAAPPALSGISVKTK